LFRSSLKKGCREFFGFSHEQLHGSQKKEVDPFWRHTPRELLQKIGTELFRVELPKLCPGITSMWIQSLERQMLSLPANAKVVISDVRFIDEAQFIQKQGGQIWLIERERLKPAFRSEISIDFKNDDQTIITEEWNPDNHP